MGNAATFPACCVTETVKVVHPSGRATILYSGEVLSVAEILKVYPHHYVREASPSRKKSKVVNSMLPLEMELKPGHTYLIIPLPRLFPPINRASSYPLSHSGCFVCVGLGDFPDSDNDFQKGYYADSPLPPKQCWSSPQTVMEVCCLGVFSIASALHYKCATGSSHEKKEARYSGLKRILTKAEIGLIGSREENEFETPWRPDLESIKEESGRTSLYSPRLQSDSPFRQSFSPVSQGYCPVSQGYSPGSHSPASYSPGRQTLGNLIEAERYPITAQLNDLPVSDVLDLGKN